MILVGLSSAVVQKKQRAKRSDTPIVALARRLSLTVYLAVTVYILNGTEWVDWNENSYQQARHTTQKFTI